MGKLRGDCYRYCLASDNCEHFTFMGVLGVHYSKQAEEHNTATRFWCPRSSLSHDCVANGGRKTICLRNEIIETNSRLDNLISTSSVTSEKSRIDEYVKIQIEIPPKDCRIM